MIDHSRQSAGGRARAAKMTPAARKRAAKAAIAARWAKPRPPAVRLRRDEEYRRAIYESAGAPDGCFECGGEHLTPRCDITNK